MRKSSLAGAPSLLHSLGEARLLGALPLLNGPLSSTWNGQGDVASNVPAYLQNTARDFRTLGGDARAAVGPGSSSQLAFTEPPPYTWGSRGFAASQPGARAPMRPAEDESKASTPPPVPPPAAPSSWYDRLPPWARPYVRLARADKPIGTWLLAWPCMWSISLAAAPGTVPDLYLMSLFGAGAVLLRGAGCTINDLWDRWAPCLCKEAFEDYHMLCLIARACFSYCFLAHTLLHRCFPFNTSRDLDSKVERTRDRPLASGELSPAQGIAFLAAQLSLGLGILLQLHPFAQLMGASSLALVATYPLMKRITYWPQAFLGLTINWGALMGYAAARGDCDWAVCLPLYAGGKPKAVAIWFNRDPVLRRVGSQFLLNTSSPKKHTVFLMPGACWTLVYDTIYAHQDRKDDQQVGIRSTALLFGENTKPVLAGFAAGTVALLSAAGLAAEAGPLYYSGVGLGAAHLARQLWMVDLDQGDSCGATFRSNRDFGGIVFLGAFLDRALGG